MVYYFCHCMSLHVCSGEFLFWIAFWLIVWERNCPFGFLVVVFKCSAVALSVSFFPFGALDGRCQVIVSIPDQCLLKKGEF